jgi:6-phosphofructokinase 1
MLATSYGACAVRALAGGETGKMVALQANNIVTVPLSEAIANIKTVASDGQLLQTARDIGISFAVPKKTKS